MAPAPADGAGLPRWPQGGGLAGGWGQWSGRAYAQAFVILGPRGAGKHWEEERKVWKDREWDAFSEKIW